MEDEKLVIKAQNGDKDAFTRLMLKYSKEMYFVAKSRLENDVDVDDAIQETMMKAFCNLKDLKEPKYFKTWIIRILYNCCTDITLSQNGKIISFEEKILESFADTNDSYFDFMTRTDLAEAFKILTKDEQVLLTLKFSNNFDNRDIAKLFNVKEGAIRMRLLRIRQKLKEKFEGGISNDKYTRQ